MSNETIPGALPMAGGWASKQPQPPGAANGQTADAGTLPNSVEGLAPAADCWASKQEQSPGATNDQATGKGNRSERFASFGALLSAFIASSWCWLPPLLILGGISGAGMTAILEGFRPHLMVATFGFLGLAFYLTYRPRRTTAGGGTSGGKRANIMKLNKVMLWAVTVIAVVFLFFPQAVTNLFASSDEFTADMDRTVIQIEGMT